MQEMYTKEELLAQISNIMQRGEFEINLRYSSLFVLFFEAFKDLVIDRLSDFYNNPVLENNETQKKETERYKLEVRSLEKNIFDASLRWFVKQGALNDSDMQQIIEIGKRRNYYVHELVNALLKGTTKMDWEQLSFLVNIYDQIDSWWVYNIEADWDEVPNPESVKREDCHSGSSLMLHIILDMALGNSQKYERCLEQIQQAVLSGDGCSIAKSDG